MPMINAWRLHSQIKSNISFAPLLNISVEFYWSFVKLHSENFSGNDNKDIYHHFLDPFCCLFFFTTALCSGFFITEIAVTLKSWQLFIFLSEKFSDTADDFPNCFQVHFFAPYVCFSSPPPCAVVSSFLKSLSLWNPDMELMISCKKIWGLWNVR